MTNRDPKPRFDYNNTIQARFETFHEKHPEVCDHLIRLADQARARGRTKVGMKQLFEVLRWERMIAGLPDEGEDFKLNNNYTSRYARYIMNRHPRLRGVFETRELKAP